MKAPVGLLSDRTVLRSKMEGLCPDKFQFVAPLRTASAVLYFLMSLLYSLFSDGLVDINLYSFVSFGKELVNGTMLPAQRISPQPAGTLVT